MSALDLHVHRWVPAETPGLPTLLMLHGTRSPPVPPLPSLVPTDVANVPDAPPNKLP